jgi:hypothetical protein
MYEKIPIQNAEQQLKYVMHEPMTLHIQVHT